MILIKSLWLYVQASLAVAESVWKRVLDPMFGMILLAGAGLSLLLGLNLEMGKAETTLGVMLIQASLSLIIIFIGTTEIPRDLETKNAQFFLSKPLGRGGYVLGKYLGILILGLMLLCTYASCLAIGSIIQGRWDARHFIIMMGQMYLQMSTLAALVVFISVFLPELAATIFGVVFYLVSYLVFIIPPVIQLFIPKYIGQVCMITYYPLPNWQHFVWSMEGIKFWHFLPLLFMYTVAYSTVVLMLAAHFFRKRDLN